MFPVSSSSGHSHPWFQALHPAQSDLESISDAATLHNNLKSLKETLDLVKAVLKEVDALRLIKTSEALDGLPSSLSDQKFVKGMIDSMKSKRLDLDIQQSLAKEAVRSLTITLRDQIHRLTRISSEKCSWEERSLATRLSQKLQKYQRNKRWKRKRRKLIAEQLFKEREMHDKADQEVDEWRAREIAKDIARRKVEKMKAVAAVKAKAEKKKIESELELILVVEKLQELRSIRIEKLKKQGHFFPEEDDKFLERVRASAEEEERQAAAATETTAAKNAIAAAEESWKIAEGRDIHSDIADGEKTNLSSPAGEDIKIPTLKEDDGNSAIASQRPGPDTSYDSLAGLPLEFYHYYHGSNNDMGTLIEVRRNWDAYIRPGGSRIPGHWVQPPPPSDDVWASYLVNHRVV
ncbi:U11/U12 small nuclear ribonucleoprotein [Wolffia australiana]